MKKRIIIGVIILVIVVSLCVSVIIYLNNKNKTNEPNEVLIESSYTNYAWGFRYSGILICKDGAMYEFNISDESINKLSLENKYKFILENSKKKYKKLKNSDINDIIEYSKNINYSNYSITNTFMNDSGATSVYVISGGKTNQIRSIGDVNMFSNDENAKKILEIIDKYI